MECAASFVTRFLGAESCASGAGKDLFFMRASAVKGRGTAYLDLCVSAWHPGGKPHPLVMAAGAQVHCNLRGAGLKGLGAWPKVRSMAALAVISICLVVPTVAEAVFASVSRLTSCGSSDAPEETPGCRLCHAVAASTAAEVGG